MREHRALQTIEDEPLERVVAPGKRTLTERMPVQRRAAPAAQAPAGRPMTSIWWPTEDPFELHLAGGPVQRKASGQAADGEVHEAAARGVAGSAGPLPYLDTIQRAFGHHDVRGIGAHTGGAARDAAAAMGATAYATGDQVAFAGAPDLHTAAHEAAHVVQQRAGVHLKGGVGAEGDVYERHADAVADAVLRGESAVALLDATPGGGGGAAAAVQHKRIIKDKDAWREAGKDDDKGVVDTTKLGEKEREALRLELEKDKGSAKLLGEILEEWKQAPSGKDEEGLAEILLLEGDLAKLEQKGKDKLEKDDQKAVDELTKILLQWQQKLVRPKEHDLRVTVIAAYLQRLGALTGKPIVAQGVGGVGLAITAEDIQAYRDDVARPGTWAGWAEAEVIAQAMGLTCAVFIKSGNQYRKVTQIGVGPRAPALSLLFLGNHYEVVGGVVDGTLVGAENVHHETEKGGDCLFESMCIIHLGSKRPEVIRLMLPALRRTVSQNLEDAQIEESIQGMLVFGDFGGLGKSMQGQLRKKSRGLKSSKWTAETLTERRKGLEKLDKEAIKQWDLDGLTEKYLEACKKDPTSGETEKALSKLLGNFEGAENQLECEGLKVDYSIYENDDSSSPLPLDRPKKQGDRDQVEQEARDHTVKRKDLKVVQSDNNGAQYLIVVEGKEYCIDRIGQLVPRYLRRNCSDENERELDGDDHDKEDGLYPTGISPFVKNIKPNVASGTGNNKIKNESGEMHHVQGHKPSPFMSATSSDKNAINPKGKEFDTNMTVVIDLSYIAPVHITALYTKQAICYFLLDGFSGKKEETANQAITEQQKKKPSSTDLAKKDKSLSEKEWQALLDVIRTYEVLIDCVVPKAAVKEEK